MKKNDVNKIQAMDSNRQESIVLAVRLILGLIFLLSGYLKLLESPADFAAAIETYQILPVKLLLPVAQWMPWFELFSGAFLVTGYLTRAAGAAAGLMNCSFLLALAWTLVKGIKLSECGCFGGAGPHLKIWQTMILDSAMILMAQYVLTQKTHRLSLDSWISK